MKQKLIILFVALLLSGLIVFVIGLHFSFGKAGIPYQDPTTEMTIRWMAYNYAGNTCMLYGAVIFLIGLVGRLACKFIKEHNS
jgi:uncharacterized membrane protein YiaA